MESHSTDMIGRIRQDLLYCLRWNVLPDLDNVEIATDPRHEEIVVPLLGSVLADESLASPPLGRLEVCIEECWGKRSYDRAPNEYRYQPLPSLVIDTRDGRSIILKEFVTQVHIYLIHHIEETKKVKGELYGELREQEDGTKVRTITYGRPYLPPNIRIFFKRRWTTARNDDVIPSVSLFVEGEHDWSFDKFRAIQMNHARVHQQERQGLNLSFS